MDYDAMFGKSWLIKADGPLTKVADLMGFTMVVLCLGLCFGKISYGLWVWGWIGVALFSIFPIGMIRARLQIAEEKYLEAGFTYLATAAFQEWPDVIHYLYNAIIDTGRSSGQWMVMVSGRLRPYPMSGFLHNLALLQADAQTFNDEGTTEDITPMGLRNRLNAFPKLAGSVPDRLWQSHYGRAQVLLFASSMTIVLWAFLNSK